MECKGGYNTNCPICKSELIEEDTGVFKCPNCPYTEVYANNEPVLGKREECPDDYKPITWGAFLKLREAAQKTADASGYPVYLVGSALYKELPRDIDVSVIMPLDKYEEMFGKLPAKQRWYSAYLGKVFHKSWEFTKHLHFCIDYDLDIKVCPDTWWIEKPKMLLAEPKNR